MDDKSSFGIIGLLIIAVAIFLLIKFAWYVLVGLGALLILFIVMLIISSKKTKSGATALEDQVREALSSIRRQKFKSEAKINRLTEWTNDAIETTYGTLFGNKYFKSELIDKYEEIKQKYASQLSEAQVEKTDMIVNGYINHIKTEKAKIETLENLQKEHEDLKEKLRLAKTNKQKNRQLDKHVNRLQSTSDDLSAEETIIKTSYSYDDLKAEVELNQEYIKQLEELTLKYGDNIAAPQVDEYKNQLEALKAKIKD